MDKGQIRISNPEELNKHLQRTSLFTWIVLGAVTALLAAFFAWSCLFELTIKLTGMASVSGGAVVLRINQGDINKVSIGQKVYIEGQEGKIDSISEDKASASSFTLGDGEYPYTVILGQKKPIEFWFGA